MTDRPGDHSSGPPRWLVIALAVVAAAAVAFAIGRFTTFGGAASVANPRTDSAEAGFAHYDPDACLINRYVAGAKLSLHKDRDERDAWAPIVSVSLGLSAVFLWGGKRRSDPLRRLRLESGDIVVWGGPARFVYHGVAPLSDGRHPLTGAVRINLTFRKVF